MKGKRILSALLAASTLWMSAVPAELTAFALEEPIKMPSGITLGTSSVENEDGTLRLCFSETYSETITFADKFDENGDPIDPEDMSKSVNGHNFSFNDYPVASAIYAMTGETPDPFSININDIELTYSWSFNTEAEATPYIGAWNWLGGYDENGNWLDVEVDPKYENLSHSAKSGSFTLKATEMDPNHTVSNYRQLGLGGGTNGMLPTDSFTFGVTDIVLDVSYEPLDPDNYVSIDSLNNCPYVEITGKIFTKEECEHDNHIGDDGVDWFKDWTHCPWTNVNVYGIKADGSMTQNGCSFVYDGDVDDGYALIKLTDITKYFETTDIKGLIFDPYMCTVDSVKGLATLPDAQLGTWSLDTTTIEEDVWSDPTIPTNTANLRYTGQIAQNNTPKQFDDYKALKIDYTLGNVKDTSAVVVVLHGWHDSYQSPEGTPDLGWTELCFKPEAKSGSVVIDLSKYYGSDYFNIYAGVAAQPTAKVGDTFAPEFKITDAKLLINYDGNFSAPIDPVTVIPNLPEVKAVAGDTTIALTWDPVYTAEGYKVNYIDKANNINITLGTKDTSYTIKNLKNGTTYDVIVLATNCDGKQVSAYTDNDFIKVTPVSPYPALPSFKVTAGEEKATLSWNAVSGATKYKVFHRLNGTASWITRNTTTTSCTITGLTGGKKYDFLVLAYNGTKWSKYTDSDIISATPEVAPPALPTLKVTAGEEKAALSWNSVTGATKYKVFYRFNGATSWITRNTTTTSCSINGLTGGKKYDFLVLAYNGTKWSKYTDSDIISATPEVVPPALPTLNVTAGDTKATLSWNAVSGATKYRVFYRLNGATSWTYKDTTAVSYTVTGLTNSKKYDFLVLAYNGTKWSKYTTSDIKYATPAVAYPALPTLNVTAGDTKATLSWNAVTGATKYRVFYRLNGATSWTYKDTTAVSYTVTGLTNSKKYDFLVLAYNGSKWSKYTASNIVNATPVLSTPALPTVKATAGNASVALSWNAVTGASKYRVFYRLNGASSWTYKDTTATSYVVTGLTNSKKYDFLVLAYNGKWSKYTTSNIINAAPSASAAPFVPTVKAAPGNAQTVLSWNKVSGATKYRVFYRVSGTSKWTYKDTTATTYTVNGLTNGKKYDFLVLAGSTKGWSKYTSADIVNATPVAAPALPTVKATAGNAKVALSWNAVTGASKYRVYYRVSGTTKWTYKDVTSTSYTITGLTNGKKYDILVLTGSTNAWSKYTSSNIVNVTPKA